MNAEHLICLSTMRNKKQKTHTRLTSTDTSLAVLAALVFVAALAAELGDGHEVEAVLDAGLRARAQGQVVGVLAAAHVHVELLRRVEPDENGRKLPMSNRIGKQL